MLQTFIGMVYVVQLTEQITLFKKFLEVTSSKEGKNSLSGTLEEEITTEPNPIILSLAKLSLQTRRALPKGSLSQ